MIHEPLMNLLKAEMPDLSWSINNFRAVDNIGAVYNRAGRGPSNGEGEIHRPLYQVLIRSSDWDKAELYAYKVQKLLHKRQNEIMDAYFYKNAAPFKRVTVEVMLLESVGGINFLGVSEDKTHEYSINFDATLHILKEEEL
ncbi:hypothetical protein J4760_04050 [Salinicoccus sp. ID82-1]|uniref:minor capsid protein n=1 Tax=Salinicoccus sp. ID82-1 TaxID=2820269 RepID=UPI001F2B66E7|nr:minor capsid protein [Salinicoccus sp. ID82-1]MCG1009224.1 hypothetical protein [Salinicoccus sp. ID82-1]